MNWHSNYTLIIPTFNRPLLLKKILAYLSYKNANFPIIILDSSPEDIKAENRQVYEGCSLEKVSYYAYPRETFFHHKCLDGLTKVTTDYVSFCADDDCLFLDALPECINYLVEHLDYVACHGYSLWFARQECPETDCVVGLEYSALSFASDSMYERLLQMMYRYEAVFYSVYRTEVLKKIYTAALAIKSFLYNEYFLGFATVATGKVKGLNRVYYGRNRIPQADPTISNWQPLYWFVENSSGLFTDYLDYRKVLLDYCSEFNSSLKNDEKSQQIMDMMHGVLFHRQCDPYYIINCLNKNLSINFDVSQFDPPKQTVEPEIDKNNPSDNLFQSIIEGKYFPSFLKNRLKSIPEATQANPINSDLERRVISLNDQEVRHDIFKVVIEKVEDKILIQSLKELSFFI